MRKRLLLMTGILVFLLSACGSATSQVEEAEISAVVEESAAEVAEEVTEAESVVETVAVEPAEESHEAEKELPTDDQATQADNEVPVELEPEPVDYEAVGVNELGHIMVVMYHGIKDNPPYHRTKEDFIKDLTFMYEHDYRPISMSDYLSGHIDVEAGMTPIVFTFDDGLPTTFSLVEENGQLDVVEDTAVDLMEDFAETYPDFGTNASFYIHGSLVNFKGDGTDAERFQWLLDHGYEFGNHSDTHASFKTLGQSALEKEIGNVYVYMDSVIPDYRIQAMTYPFGIRPQDNLMSVVSDGSYQGYDFDLQVAFREGPSGIFYPPMHVKFQAFNAPRVRGSEGEVQDLWWFLEHYEAHPEKKYVSDGDPNTIVVPENMADSLVEGVEEEFEVLVY